MKKEKVVFFKTPIMKSLLSRFTPLKPKWLGRGKVPIF